MATEHILCGPEPYAELPNESIGQQLYNSLLKFQHIPVALVDPVSGLSVSYKEIYENTCCLANALKHHGYSKNSVVGILSENSRQYVNPLLAALYLGCTVTTFNPNSTPGELLYVSNISKPAIIFCSKAAANLLLKTRPKMDYLNDVLLIDSDEDAYGIKSVNNYVRKFDRNKFNPVCVNPFEDIAFIIYSSGTTGFPKGVMLTHNNFSSILNLKRDPQYSYAKEPGKEPLIAVSPTYHAYGLFVLIDSIYVGQKLIILSKFDVIVYLKAIQDYKITKLYIVPPLANLLANTPLLDKFDLNSVTYIGCGAAPLSIEIEERLKRRFKNLKQFRQSYGMTEATLSVTSFYLDDSKVGSCGKILPAMCAKIVNQDGKVLGPEQRGEICIKGPSVMKGYAGNEESTNSVLTKDGWLSTGDIGYYDQDGYFYIVDRIKELIKYRGYQVAPAELEALLLTHSKILDAAVVGLPDEISGELPIAFIIKKPNQNITEDEVKDFVTQNASREKWLRGGVRFVNEIPKSASGKILRKQLRDLLTQRSKL